MARPRAAQRGAAVEGVGVAVNVVEGRGLGAPQRPIEAANGCPPPGAVYPWGQQTAPSGARRRAHENPCAAARAARTPVGGCGRWGVPRARAQQCARAPARTQSGCHEGSPVPTAGARRRAHDRSCAAARGPN